ncbi:uncharacterized protein FIBRA_06123 [Fibroporia radiculosa]|uniref:Glycosyltransferase 2-like domain-containing protein n=1 Tax=Fibroporia radiculosa TaxID=599839 RepID=J4HYM0_9APHY|nr:uncharacterized protein FIBRA_06123 [Fibroporia radiculosa]CCM03967.1 predicted protein [Fibroporia radiculosa]
MTIIIVDDPTSPNIGELMDRYAHRPDVRIRVNPVNSGASASRNRGLQESSAEWALFLDDDVTPEQNILVEAEKAIRSNPAAAGFVGNAQFPVADTIATAAIHLAGVTYFWDIAKKRADDPDLPWGVTANLIARRNVRDDVTFDLGFPKTGGGEDIDFCRRKRNYSIAHGGGGFYAAPNVVVTHPWWNKGQRYYWRFYMWSKGDGALVAKYPEYSYRQAAPTSAETLVLCVIFTTARCVFSLLQGNTKSVVLTLSIGTLVFASGLAANVVHDLYRHLWRNVDRLNEMKIALDSPSLVMATIESTIIRIISEYGRLVGMVERREFKYIGRSFDWFTDRAGDGPKTEENRNRVERLTVWLVLSAIVVLLVS